MGKWYFVLSKQITKKAVPLIAAIGQCIVISQLRCDTNHRDFMLRRRLFERWSTVYVVGTLRCEWIDTPCIFTDRCLPIIQSRVVYVKVS